MRNVLRGLALVAFLGACAIPLAWSVSPPSQCRGADAWTARTGPWLDSLLTRTDSLNTSLRQKLNLAQTSSSQIKLISKAQTCAQAAQAVDLLAQTPNSGRKVWVYQIGAAYAVSDSAADRRVEPGQLVDFFNSSFGYISSTVTAPPY
jgi:hypothetical protein